MADHILFLLASFWLLGLIRLLFSKSLGWAWSLSAILLFVFYIIFYKDPLLTETGRFIEEPWATSQELLQTGFAVLPLALFALWPVVLWQLVRMPSPLAERRFQTLFLLTIFYWLFWFGLQWMGYQPNELIRRALSGVGSLELPKPPVE